MVIIPERIHFLLVLSHLWGNMVLGPSPSDSLVLAKEKLSSCLTYSEDYRCAKITVRRVE